MVRMFDTFASFDQVFDSLFYSWPKQIKPPIERFPVYDSDGNITRVEIQMALAGFKKGDVKVYAESGLLHIEGDNTKNKEVAERFRSNFSHQFSYSKKLDVDKAEVSLDNGVLMIKIPVQEEVKNKKLLFG